MSRRSAIGARAIIGRRRSSSCARAVNARTTPSPSTCCCALTASPRSSCACSCCATRGSASTTPSRSLMSRARPSCSTTGSAPSCRRTAFTTISPITRSTRKAGGCMSGPTRATHRPPTAPSAKATQCSAAMKLHQQKKAVHRQQRRHHGEQRAQPQQRARGGDNAHRAQHDRDLEQRAGVIEIEITPLRVVALRLELARLGEQFLLAAAGGGVALVALHSRSVVGDAPIERLALGGGQVGSRRQQRLERVGGELVGGLALVAGLVEGV